MRSHNACKGDTVCAWLFFVAVICNLYVRLACLKTGEKGLVCALARACICVCVGECCNFIVIATLNQ